jgi:hypothetical protein
MINMYLNISRHDCCYIRDSWFDLSFVRWPLFREDHESSASVEREDEDGQVGFVG